MTYRRKRYLETTQAANPERKLPAGLAAPATGRPDWCARSLARSATRSLYRPCDGVDPSVHVLIALVHSIDTQISRSTLRIRVGGARRCSPSCPDLVIRQTAFVIMLVTPKIVQVVTEVVARSRTPASSTAGIRAPEYAVWRAAEGIVRFIDSCQQCEIRPRIALGKAGRR
jgi:hypothetical protein